ncbi:MAG: TetR/AcrR family transcriptional regulator [Solirubrobacteraceae bacterium]
MASTTPSRPGEHRRRRLSEEQRRTQIIRGCVDVLAGEGYRGASLARIARAAGVSKGLVSHYFSDRDTLMEQTAIATVAEVRQGVADAIDLTAEVPEVLRAAVRYASQLRRTHSRELRAVDQIVHNLRDPDGAPRLDLRAYEDTYVAQERLLRRGQAEGSLREFDTRVMAVTYQGAVDTMIAYLDAHPEVDATAYADALTELLLSAIRR